MIVEYIRYDVGEGHGDELARAYEAASESLRASPHCLAYELSRCAEAPSTFVLRIEWDSADGHLKGFRTSAEFKPFFAAVQPFMKSMQEMRHYERTALAWRRPT